MVYLHSFLLQFFPKRAARKKQFLMSVLTEQRLTKFQELPVICNVISSTMTFVNYRNLTNEILVRGSQRRLYLFRESFKSFYRSGSPIGPIVFSKLQEYYTDFPWQCDDAFYRTQTLVSPVLATNFNQFHYQRGL